MRAFTQAERFVSDLQSRKMRAAYVFVGDEAFSASVFWMRFLNIWCRLTYGISVFSNLISPRQI